MDARPIACTGTTGLHSRPRRRPQPPDTTYERTEPVQPSGATSFVDSPWLRWKSGARTVDRSMKRQSRTSRAKSWKQDRRARVGQRGERPAPNGQRGITEAALLSGPGWGGCGNGFRCIPRSAIGDVPERTREECSIAKPRLFITWTVE
jgi:hypothetical protein